MCARYNYWVTSNKYQYDNNLEADQQTHTHTIFECKLYSCTILLFYIVTQPSKRWNLIIESASFILLLSLCDKKAIDKWFQNLYTFV